MDTDPVEGVLKRLLELRTESEFKVVCEKNKGAG